MAMTAHRSPPGKHAADAGRDGRRHQRHLWYGAAQRVQGAGFVNLAWHRGGQELVCSMPVDEAGKLNPQPGECWTASWSAARTIVVRQQ